MYWHCIRNGHIREHRSLNHRPNNLYSTVNYFRWGSIGSFFLPLLHLSLLSFLYCCSFTRNCASGIASLSAYDPKAWPLATVYDSRCVLVTSVFGWSWRFLSFSWSWQKGKKKAWRQTGQKLKSFPKLTHMTKHLTLTLSQHLHHTSCSFHPTTHIQVSIVDETLSGKYRWHLSEIQTQRANTLLFSFSPHTRTGCLKEISNGRVEGGLYLPIKCVFKVSFHLAGNCISFVGL